MSYLFTVILGYLLGCSHMAFYISKLRQLDIRTAGSGNLGASNVTVLFGWKAGILTGFHDVFKSAIAVWLAGWLFPNLPYAGAAAGVAAVFGHIFPFYLKFRGGKGLASYFGMILALNWKIALLTAIVILLATLITDFISVGALSSIVIAPISMGLLCHNWLLAGILCIASCVMFYKHWENIQRIANKEEIGLRSTLRGERRVNK